MYMYLTEAFPSSVRSTAFGLAMGIGRGGRVLGAALGGADPVRSPTSRRHSCSIRRASLLVTLFRFETSQ